MSPGHDWVKPSSNHSAADRTGLRKTALKVILETLLRQTQDLTQEDDSDVLLTPGQVAGIFAVSTRDVAEYADWGILNPVFTTGGKRLYRKSEVESVLAMSPEECNARRNPVTEVSGEDVLVGERGWTFYQAEQWLRQAVIS